MATSALHSWLLKCASLQRKLPPVRYYTDSERSPMNTRMQFSLTITAVLFAAGLLIGWIVG